MIVGLTACAGPSSTPQPTPSKDAAAPLPAPSQIETSAPTPSPTPEPVPSKTAEAFDKSKFSIDEPSSYWVVVNKLRPLDPQDFVAPDLVAVKVPFVHAPSLRLTAARSAEKMFAAFTSETGLAMQAQSAYRSYSTQVGTYNGWVAELGQAGADKTSARPGHSEHQTGLAIDISASPAVCSLDQCFSDTPQGKWLAKNAHKYGFHLRYPDGKTDVTGYEFEPWHYRFVGKALATELHETGTETLEEFFGLPAATTYAG